MAYQGATVASIWADLKEYMDSQEMADLIFKNNPLFGLLKKDTGLEGKYFPQPLVIAGSAGGGANFANASANVTGSVQRAFNVPTFPYYQIGRLSGLANALSKTNAGAYENGLKLEMEAAMRELTKAVSIYAYRDGVGTIGVVSGSVTSGVVNLATPSDAMNFVIGQAVQAFDASTLAPIGGGSIGYVVSVDFSTGKVVVAASQGGSPATPTSWATTNLLVQQGNFNSVMKGLLAWLPTTGRPTPGTPEDFLGVDRSIDPTMLAGVYQDASNVPIEEGLIDFISQICTNGGNPDFVFLNPVSYRAVAKALQARHGYVDVVTEAGISYRALAIEGDMGKVGLISDRNCPAKTGFGLQMDTWTLASSGKTVKVWDQDGQEYLRSPGIDAVEFRLVSYSTLACSAPGFNGVAKLPV